MTTRDRLAACIVAVLWGLNFIAIHASLEQFPPLFLVALRFAMLAVPTILLVPRPDVPLRWLVGYGVGFGILQFAFLYTGMAAGMPAGLASLVLQASGPFTLVLGVLLMREHVTRHQWVGLAVALTGMAIVGVSRFQASGFWPYVLVLLGALGWAVGNLSSRLARPTNPLHLTMWMSVVPPIPMLLLSLWLEGPTAIGDSLRTSLSTGAVPAWLGLLYTVVVATVVGSGIWTWLLTRHRAGLVAPFSMLVPVVGIAAAALILDERPSPVELLGAALVVAGVLAGSRHTPAAEPPDPAPEETPAPCDEMSQSAALSAQTHVS
ncbi:MAG: EamA family transporter [Micrococcales bacterium]|nr:EamA family transporter [Micrococcales bacterium]